MSQQTWHPPSSNSNCRVCSLKRLNCISCSIAMNCLGFYFCRAPPVERVEAVRDKPLVLPQPPPPPPPEVNPETEAQLRRRLHFEKLALRRLQRLPAGLLDGELLGPTNDQQAAEALRAAAGHAAQAGGGLEAGQQHKPATGKQLYWAALLQPPAAAVASAAASNADDDAASHERGLRACLQSLHGADHQPWCYQASGCSGMLLTAEQRVLFNAA